MIIDLEKAQWHRKWDLGERDLSLDLGFPSNIATSWQKSFLTVFGSVGSFPSSTEGRVGFAQITTRLPLDTAFYKWHLLAKSSTPGVKFLFILKSADDAMGSYQAPFELNENLQKISFSPADFQFKIRGKSATGQMDIHKINSVGILLTRSSQEAFEPEAQIFFELDLHQIAWE